VKPRNADSECLLVTTPLTALLNDIMQNRLQSCCHDRSRKIFRED
jgi:hypothetical protein